MHSPTDCLALSQQLVEWLIGSSLPLALALALALAGSGSRQVTMKRDECLGAGASLVSGTSRGGGARDCRVCECLAGGTTRA